MGAKNSRRDVPDAHTCVPDEDSSVPDDNVPVPDGPADVSDGYCAYCQVPNPTSSDHGEWYVGIDIFVPLKTNGWKTYVA